MSISIKNRIRLGFGVLITIFFVNGIITIATLDYNKKLSDHISEVVNPSVQGMYDLRKSLLETRMFTTNWVFLRYDQESKSQLLALRDSVFPNLKEKMNSLSGKWFNRNMADSLQKLFVGFEELFQQEEYIINSLQRFEDYDNAFKKFGAEDALENKIIPSFLELFDLLNHVLKHERDERTEEQNKLEQALSFLQMLIIILALTIVALGILLSIYLSNIIIKPINKIQAIIKDLGRGVIRQTNLKQRNDEIGLMIKSINTLAEKFSAMQTFALNVGRREFEAHYEPMSKEDALGKALLSMRDGLRESEKKLLRTHFQMETLFKKIDEVFFSMDMISNKILQMSPACEKVYGFHATEFFKNPMLWFELTLEEDRHLILANDSIMRSGKTINHETRIRHRDNSIRWIETKITPTLNAQGVLERIDGVVIDITDRKGAQELLCARNAELMKSNMELDKFVYSISHDLRAPLLSVLGIIKLAQEDTVDTEMTEHLMLMESSIRRLDGFILDILDYSRNSKHELKKSKIDFRDVFSTVTNNLKYINGSRKIDIKLNVEGTSSFYSDKERISVVLNNLISNAVWYQNPEVSNPFVDVNIDLSDTETNIIVKDNGIGISKENQQKVFEMFYRASKNSVGSGLGLYVVKEIVDKLNGKIEVESEPGRGSSFIIHLPNNKVSQEIGIA